MDGLFALALVVLAAAYLLRRTARTFHDPQAGACGGSEACGSSCASTETPEPPLVQLDLPR